jgi:Domain of unknown function (DUF4270)
MNRFSFLKYSVFVLSAFLFLTACDKDFNEVGADIIGDGNFEFTNYKGATVTTYNQFDAAVQTNNLPINQLGVIDNNSNPNDPLKGFGTTTSSFVVQLQLSKAYENIPATAVVDQVELVVPYFSTELTSNTDGTKTYQLDSIYPYTPAIKKTLSDKIKLSIYENKKFLRNYNDILESQRYYSDEFSVFDANRGLTLLNNDSNLSQNSEFQFSAAQQEEYEIGTDNSLTLTSETSGVEKTNKVTPRMKLKLSKAEFQTILFNNSAKLANNGVFQEHFRGLFFKVENVGAERAMAMMNFAAGKVYVYYKDVTTDTKRKAIVLNMSGNSVNLFQNQYKSNLPTSTTPIVASDNLYLKGGAGYHSYIDLFGTANSEGIVVNRTEINSLKANNWILNEANLVFTIDETKSSTEKPKRIYIYDSKNKRPILDYVTDGSTSTTKPKYSKTTHGGILSSTTKDGITTYKYKFRITDHIKNIINKDSTNVRLGISVTEDIAKVGNRYMKNSPDNSYFNSIPEASVINPLGVILWGSAPNVSEDKRVKLEIFYTKPN